MQHINCADPTAKKGLQRSHHRPVFTQAQTEAFLTRNKLSLLIRSHEHKVEGFEVCHNNHCWTVFSAPNYCGTGRNKAAVLKFNPVSDLFHAAYVVQFNAATNREPGVCKAICVKLPVSVTTEPVDSVPVTPEPAKTTQVPQVPTYTIPVPVNPILITSLQVTLEPVYHVEVLVDIDSQDCDDDVEVALEFQELPDVESTEYFEDVELDLP